MLILKRSDWRIQLQKQSVYQNIGLGGLVGGMLLLFIVAVPAVFASGDEPILVGSNIKVTIQGMTETSIKLKTGIYTVSPEARIIDQNGNKIKLLNLASPCLAEITAEVPAGQRIPAITEIREIKSLLDRNLRRNRISQYPE